MHIISMAHTGNRFTAELFGIDMVQENYTHLESTHNAGEAFKQGRAHKGRIIMPLRAPGKVLDTWSKNNRHSINNFNGVGRSIFIASWAWMLSFYEQFEPYLLPVDHPDKDAYLERIIADLKPSVNRELRESWRPVGHNPHDPQPVAGLDLAMPYNACKLMGVDYGEPPTRKPASVRPDSRARASFGIW